MEFDRHTIVVLAKSGQVLEAAKLCKAYCDEYEDAIDAWFVLGQLNGRMREYEISISCFQHVLKLDSRCAEAYFNLGKIYFLESRYDDAVESFRQALKLRPEFTEAYSSLANVLLEFQQLEEAISLFVQALHFAPDFENPYCYFISPLEQKSNSSPYDTYRAYIYSCLGRAQRKLGCHEEACECYRRALEIKPDYTDAHSNLLFLLGYHVLCSPEEMLEESRNWDKRQGKIAKSQVFSHASDRASSKRLRIGYVSPDMRHHAVGHFVEPILAEHDRSQVEVFCYAEVKHPDNVTERFQIYADHWRATVGMPDRRVAELIYEDRIDILVDLAGHTANNRLKAFIYKPAPIQVTYLGYFATTGLSAMDYWITDEVLHPPDTTELAVESFFRLSRCCLAYQPSPDAPEVVSRDAGDIVFGSFNQFSKISPSTIALWSKVLHAVPKSRMLIKTMLFADSKVRSIVQKQFDDHGVSSDRLILLPGVRSQREHLSTYGYVDIALDTIPRTGGSTTTESLWMGVPVVTLAGERFIERLSASMLSAVGLEELIATSPQDYVDKAVALAGDVARRRALRATQRERMAASPLCDGRGLAQALETAYRGMWRAWLSGAGHGG